MFASFIRPYARRLAPFAVLSLIEVGLAALTPWADGGRVTVTGRHADVLLTRDVYRRMWERLCAS